MYFIACHRVSQQTWVRNGEIVETRGETAPQRRSGRERGGTGTKPGSVTADGTAADKKGTETVTCRVGSERSPCPVLVCSWRQEADVRWECDVKAATNWDFRNCKKQPCQIAFP